MRTRGIVAAALVAGAFCVGCLKTEVSFDTMYVLRPYVQDSTGSPMRSLAGVRAFAFDADTSQWMVASYEDALAGRISRRHAPDEKRSDAVASASAYPAVDTIPSSANWLQMRILLPSALIVAVDTEHRLYGWRQQTFSENLSPYVLSVVFRPWRDSYRDEEWYMCNDFYEETPAEPEEPDGSGGVSDAEEEAPVGGTDAAGATE